MGKKMTRHDRWDHREALKVKANEHNNLAFTHPQARRGIEETVFMLSDEEWDEYTATIEAPPEPSESLRRLMKE